ncbi:DUF917 domain-containing protein [Salipiger sp. P9]|uniref:DUF917 domain-containing protein n=1 Tax=Salipiger pentaromativorans TaxID=2943193 RepID=UPI0021571368|nr:DUF917 domain-containing protein [Salipiger pentaromativorans]MCR8546922.1 DUF917 domain-containing protein [Salipiger pentaromativorans]
MKSRSYPDLPAREISAEEIEHLAVGAWVLGTGGGGSPYLALLNMRRLYADGHRVSLMSPMDLPDDARVAVVSNMGAPLVTQERLSDSRACAHAVRIQQDYLGQEFDAVMSVEIGGGNGIQALMAATHLGIPVVDTDFMGRAYPEAQMTSSAIGDLRPTPNVLYDVRGIEAIIRTAPSWKWVERVGRKMVTEMGSTASTCKAPRSGAEVKRWGIHFTTTKAIGIGRTLAEAQRRHADPIAALIETEGAKLLFTGKVTDVERRTTEGFLRGTARLSGLDADAGRELTVSFQNEWVVAWDGPEPRGTAIATTPDLICLLDSVTAHGIGTETIRYGQRVSVLAMEAPEVLRTPKGLEHVGPRAFGYDLDYKSVFDLEAAE